MNLVVKKLVESRTYNVARNVKFSLICQIITLAASFVCRTIFVKTLGVEYLGISGLFTNILTVLSFAELGIGDAIIFSLYKPISENNYEKIKSLMTLYKKAYMLIGIFILTMGIACIPFLDNIVAKKPNISESLTFIYMLFLMNIVISYFFVYKQNLIKAQQKNYIVVLQSTVITIIMYTAQTLVLLLFRNYILYLLLNILSTLITNISLAKKANKEFPYLKDKTIEKISIEETKKIFGNVKALVVYKLGSVILNGSDNILISMLIGIKEVGIVSNFYMVINAFETLLTKIKSAFVASVGNLNSLESAEKKEYVFNKIFLIVAWLYGFVSLGMLCMGNELVQLWVGTDYMISNITLFALVLNMYVIGVHSVSFMYRSTLGLYKEGQIAPIIATVVNIVLSVILCRYQGLAGILLATPISRMLGMGIVDPILIYTRAFNKNPLTYYRMYAKYALIFIIIYILLKNIILFIGSVTWVVFITKIIIITVVYNAIMYLCFRKNVMFKEILHAAIAYVTGRFLNDKK